MADTGNLALIPASGDLYAFGDSQTYGSNSAYPGGRLPESNRWPDIVATRRQRSLTVNNLAVGGTKISFNGGASEYSHFNMTNPARLPYQWTGSAVCMCGWNNTDSGTTTDAFFSVLQRAHEAMIAKLLIDDYAGLSFVGWSRADSATQGQYSWSTSGSNNQQTTSEDNLKPFDDAGSDLAARYRTQLDSAGEFIQFTVTGKRAVALFLETSSTGGEFTVSVNGSEVGTWSTEYANIGGNDVGAYPYVVWLENVPNSCQVRIENVSGVQYFLAFGWVDKDGYYLRRQIIYGTTTGNNANGRTNDILDRAAASAQHAAGAFGDYPVVFANCRNRWVESTDQQAGDISHLTPVGNENVFKAFDSASSQGCRYSPNFVRM